MPLWVRLQENSTSRRDKSERNGPEKANTEEEVGGESPTERDFNHSIKNIALLTGTEAHFLFLILKLIASYMTKK